MLTSFLTHLLKLLGLVVTLPVTTVVVLFLIFKNVNEPKVLLVFLMACIFATCAFIFCVSFRLSKKMATDAIGDLRKLKKSYYLKRYNLSDFISVESVLNQYQLEYLAVYVAVPKSSKQKGISTFRAYPLPGNHHKPIICGVKPEVAGPMDIFHILHEVGHVKETGYFHNLNAQWKTIRIFLYYLPLIAFVPEFWSIFFIGVLAAIHVYLETSKDYAEISADQFALDLMKKLYPPSLIDTLVTQRVSDLQSSLGSSRNETEKTEYASRIEGFTNFAQSEKFLLHPHLDEQHKKILNKVRPLVLLAIIYVVVFGNTEYVVIHGLFPMVVIMWIAVITSIVISRITTAELQTLQQELFELTN